MKEWQLNNIIGHTKQLDFLNKLLSSKKIHHAWIFSGPSGVGKSLVAKHFATLLIDKNTSKNLTGWWDSDPAGVTPKRISKKTHPDYFFIEKELSSFSKNSQLRNKKQTNIPIDLLRECLLGGTCSDGVFYDSPLGKSPILGKARVFVINESDLIKEDGQNALLKSLEEPPSKTYLILVTHQPQKLLPTIHSRCQTIRFGVLSKEEMLVWLNDFWPNRCPNEDPWILRFSCGCPGKADLALKMRLPEFIQSIHKTLFVNRGVGLETSTSEKISVFIDDWGKLIQKENREASKEVATRQASSMIFEALGLLAREKLLVDENKNNTLKKIDALYEAESRIKANINVKHVIAGLVAEWESF